MAHILTSQETPLAWPKEAAVGDLTTTKASGIKISVPASGSLQILSRRPIGDGVNIQESAAISADYRGQRYNFNEAVLHVPGLHVFPGQNDPYPAEYHIHMSTLSKPQRSLTIVIPVKQVTGGMRSEDGPDVGGTYFQACMGRPDPNANRPNLLTILKLGSDTIQYQGPDIRGRTRDAPASRNAGEHQFILSLIPTYIRATDLERIPRQGSMSPDARDMPVPGVKPSLKVDRSRLIKTLVLARPGIIDPNAPPAAYGIPPSSQPPVIPELNEDTTIIQETALRFALGLLFACSFLVGYAVINIIIGRLFWQNLFSNSRAAAIEPITIIIILTICISVAYGFDDLLKVFTG